MLHYILILTPYPISLWYLVFIAPISLASKAPGLMKTLAIAAGEYHCTRRGGGPGVSLRVET